ncbi:MAG: ABC transporter permease [Gemmatimonadetes bacterium]|nr:ABC transporter permease [Gemmatimonadota bacterium]
MPPGERVYRLLLRLLPRRLREEHGAELVEAYRDRSAEPRHRGLLGRFRLWTLLVLDLPRGAALARRGVRRPSRGDGIVSTLGQDLRYALRSFRRHPGFFLAAVATLALGVGAGTAVFSVVDAVVLRPLPYPEADRLVVVGTTDGESDRTFSSSPVDVRDWAERSRTLEALAASRLERRVLRGVGEPEEVLGAGVSAAWFDVLGVRPALGRAFTEAEDRPGVEGVAVLSHGFWTRRFGGDLGVLGRTLRLDGEPFTVVGVMGPGFHPPEAISHGDVEVWYPIQRVQDDLTERANFFVQALGRLAPDASLEAARDELRTIGESLSAETPEAGLRWPVPDPMRQSTVGEVGPRLLVLGGAVGLLLLIACANVANLFLLRASERSREMAVRCALGAARGRLARQLLTESLLLSAAAALLALGLAEAAVRSFRAFGPGDLPRLGEVAVDYRVLAFGLALALATGVVFGLLPAGEATKPGPAGALRESGPGAGGGRSRLRGALVVAQTAVALVLLVGSGLLVHSFVRLVRVDPGFDARGVAWMTVRVDGSEYPTDEERIAFFGALHRDVAGLPGVERAGGTNILPLGRSRNMTWMTPEGMELGPDEEPPVVSWHQVLPGTFEALGIPLRRGRAFTPADDAEARRVMLVNESLARTFWPGQDPLGRRVALGNEGENWTTVIGVVGDVRQQGLASEPEPEFYMPFLAGPRTAIHLVVRTPGDPAALLEPMKAQVHALDPSLPVDEYGTLPGHVRASITEPRFYTGLLTAFAGLALLLAMVGVYGTTAYAVEQRTHEVGVRMALGARSQDVVALVVRRGALLTALGLGLGLGAALVATRVLESFVFGVSATDPATLAVVTAGLGALGLLAAWIPARRAARLDPARTLRSE